MTSFLAPYPTFGTKNKRLPPSQYERSPYYWWFEYLRRNADYIKCCEANGKTKLSKLYEDFGDVRDIEFRVWWTKEQRGTKLFGEKKFDIKFEELIDKSKWNEEWQAEDVLIVSVPLEHSKRTLQKWFATLLKRRHSAKRGRTAMKWSKSTAKYPINRNYTIASLRTALEVYDEYVENLSRGEGKLKIWEMGVKLKLVQSAMPKSTDTKEDRLVKRNVMAATVVRYYKQAQKIIESTSKGVFPN